MRSASFLPAVTRLYRPKSNATFRLFCLPYAGGSGAIFRDWPALLSNDIDVCPLELPGRGSRIAEPVAGSMAEIVAELSATIDEFSNLPYFLFGYSMGGLLAFELAHWRRTWKLRNPDRLIIGATAAPDASPLERDLHKLSDNDLLEELRQYNGTPEAILQNKELMQLVMPAIRADFALVEKYRPEKRATLSIPVDVILGTADAYIERGRAEAWAETTSAHCQLHYLDGDHFFIHSAQEALLSIVQNCFKPATITGTDETL